MINVMIDGSALLLTAWVRGVRAVWWKVLLAAFCGSLYAVLAVFPSLAFLFGIPVKLAVSVVMLLIVFGFGSIQHFVRLVFVFYAVNFVAGGAVLGLHYLLMSGSGEMKDILMFIGGRSDVHLRLGIVFLFSLISVGFYMFRSILMQRKERDLVRSHIAEVSVMIEGCERNCTGLIDTGNQLYEPLTRTPVMVMEASLWQEDLPPGWIKRIRDAEVDKLLATMQDEPFMWQDRLRLVPYRGVNRGAQFMLAIKPDLVVVRRDGEVYETRKVLVGLDAGRLAADGAYQAIVHPSLLHNQTNANGPIHSSSGRDGAACSSNGN